MIAAILASLLNAAVASAQIPCKYDVEIIPHVDCGIIGQGPMVLSAINNHSEVIGWSTGCGEPGHYRSYTWLSGPTLTQLPIPPGSIGFRATDLNDNNIICGFADYNNGQHRAWVYNRTTNVWTQIPPVNTQIGWSSAAALNNAGLVVGYRGIGNGEMGWPWNAFIFDLNTGVIIDLGVMNGPNSGAMAISENGIVVGWTGTSNSIIYSDVRAFVQDCKDTEILEPVLGGINSFGGAVNSSKQLLVRGIINYGPPAISRTDLVTNTTIMQLAVPPGFDRVGASAIDESGIIYGSCNDANFDFHGFIWFGSQYFAIQDLIQASFQVAAPSISTAADSGQIVGQGWVKGLMVNVRFNPLPILYGDVNCDSIVGVPDLLGIINTWGECNGCRSDLDRNGTVDVWDLFLVIQNWGNTS